jgi:hypothetical protein
MKNIPQKVNLMTALTSVDSVSDKILDNSSMKNKGIRKIVEFNAKKKTMLSI